MYSWACQVVLLASLFTVASFHIWLFRVTRIAIGDERCSRKGVVLQFIYITLNEPSCCMNMSNSLFEFIGLSKACFSFCLVSRLILTFTNSAKWRTVALIDVLMYLRRRHLLLFYVAFADISAVILSTHLTILFSSGPFWSGCGLKIISTDDMSIDPSESTDCDSDVGLTLDSLELLVEGWGSVRISGLLWIDFSRWILLLGGGLKASVWPWPDKRLLFSEIWYRWLIAFCGSTSPG